MDPAPNPTEPAPNNNNPGRHSLRSLTELGRPTDTSPGVVPFVEEPFWMTPRQMWLPSCRLLLVSPNADGSSNADNVTLDATIDSTTACSCTKPTEDQALYEKSTASTGLMFVAHHGCAIAREVYREHGLYGDDGRWCGVKLLHNATGTFHAAWVGPFWPGNSVGQQEYTVRVGLEQRGLNAHARIFECGDFQEEDEDWDYVFEGPGADEEESADATDEEAGEEEEGEQLDDEGAGEEADDG